MAVITDKADHDLLKKTVGSRLKRARNASGVTEENADLYFLDEVKSNDQLKIIVGTRLKISRCATQITESVAARKIGYRNSTQVSLAESGERLPPLRTLLKLANLYNVTLDYLCGRHNDSAADPLESNAGVIGFAVSNGVKDYFTKFTQSMSEHVALIISGQRRDRIDIKMMIQAIADMEASLNRLKLLNPEFEEEWRGGANFQKELDKLTSLSENAYQRIERERLMSDLIDRKILIQDLGDNVKQFLLDLEII